ncbi:hypothetical protein Dvina_30545 [Dactylosporangium vinaceum]|uniref:Tat pathway signal sequence domain protein n=1 Tax=Dactylosporangium vinaceum TaxID=53362 RepID=A0ABV5MJP8_9ACTN|nr:hypothetical protein [Dactylosporangium vinaceum]UAB92667.1 hypothetical protein Dvina_30545 [Dactylosporangium vinaceum]
MSTFAAPRPANLSARMLAAFAALTAILSTAFLLAPPPLAALGPDGGYADEPALTDAAGTAFTGYWSSGEAGLTPDLERLVDYWVRFHIFKTAFAVVLAIVLATLTVRLWRAFLAAADQPLGRRTATATAGTLTAALTLVAIMLVMANIQCTLSPLSSLATFLDHAPAGTLTGVRAQLHATVTTGAAASPPVQHLIDDFGWYHAVMAVLGALTAVAFAALSWSQWRHFARPARPARRARRVHAVFGTLAALTAVAFALLAYGNTGVAADPAPALLAFFEGGW